MERVSPAFGVYRPKPFPDDQQIRPINYPLVEPPGLQALAGLTITSIDVSFMRAQGPLSPPSHFVSVEFSKQDQASLRSRKFRFRH